MSKAYVVTAATKVPWHLRYRIRLRMLARHVRQGPWWRRRYNRVLRFLRLKRRCIAQVGGSSCPKRSTGYRKYLDKYGLARLHFCDEHLKAWDTK